MRHFFVSSVGCYTTALHSQWLASKYLIPEAKAYWLARRNKHRLGHRSQLWSRLAQNH